MTYFTEFFFDTFNFFYNINNTVADNYRGVRGDKNIHTA